MTKRLADHLRKKLSELGQAIDIDRPIIVYDDGEVGIVENSNEEYRNEREGTRGSAAGSGERTKAGSRRAPGEAAPVGSFAEQAIQLADLEGLRSAYRTTVKEGNHGLWIIVKSKPLGTDGPQVTFVLAYPYPSDIPVRAWGFWKVGEFPEHIGPRHTNFPDASICAFGPDDGAWERQDGTAALVDLYSTWVVRQLCFLHFGRWPGRQHGASALYRRAEFYADEWCGCGSNRRYGECHQTDDLLLSEDQARTDHVNRLGSDYTPRHPPKSVLKFVKSKWNKIPRFEDVYENR